MNVNKNLSINKNFKVNSPMFNLLNHIIKTEPINNATQLKIENLLINQYLDVINNKESIKNNNSLVEILKTPLVKKYEEYNDLLLKLIVNYKNKNLDFLAHKIIFVIPNKVLLSIMLSRIVNIAANNGRFNKNTNLMDVTLGLGAEIINQYLVILYKKIKKSLKSQNLLIYD
jgi:hypothetical protein